MEDDRCFPPPFFSCRDRVRLVVPVGAHHMDVVQLSAEQTAALVATSDRRVAPHVAAALTLSASFAAARKKAKCDDVCAPHVEASGDVVSLRVDVAGVFSVRWQLSQLSQLSQAPPQISYSTPFYVGDVDALKTTILSNDDVGVTLLLRSTIRGAAEVRVVDSLGNAYDAGFTLTSAKFRKVKRAQMRGWDSPTTVRVTFDAPLRFDDRDLHVVVMVPGAMPAVVGPFGPAPPALEEEDSLDSLQSWLDVHFVDDVADSPPTTPVWHPRLHCDDDELIMSDGDAHTS